MSQYDCAGDISDGETQLDAYFGESIQRSSVAHRSRGKHGLAWKVNFSFEATDGLDSPIISFLL